MALAKKQENMLGKLVKWCTHTISQGNATSTASGQEHVGAIQEATSKRWAAAMVLVDRFSKENPSPWLVVRGTNDAMWESVLPGRTTLDEGGNREVLRDQVDGAAPKKKE